jgi:hypothetical protein
MKKVNLFVVILGLALALGIFGIYDYYSRKESQDIPAWIMADRFNRTSYPETIIKVTEIDSSKLSKLVDAILKADNANSVGLPHPLEMLKLSNYEAREIIKFLGGRYSSERKDYSFLINLGEKLYSIYMVFSREPPPLF